VLRLPLFAMRIELLAELADEDDVDDPGPEEPPETPVSRPGDLWILGNHRLLCGDSTNADDIIQWDQTELQFDAGTANGTIAFGKSTATDVQGPV